MLKAQRPILFGRMMTAIAVCVFMCLLGIVRGDEPNAAGPSVAFERDIATILVKNCLGCHNASQASGGLNLDSREHLVAGGESGAVVTPGEPDASYLIERVTDGSMPPEGKGKRLAAADVETLRRWVSDGCAWPTERQLSLYEFTTDQRAGFDWWSLQPVVRPEVPKAANGERNENPIDAFLLKTLHARQLDFAPPADRATLIRRATFDLTGLPPTPEEIHNFVNDAAPDAYSRLIERLLASPRYGERWAQHWLDVVRFSESKGFERDRLRDNAWRYRDWVIDALNHDMPYDEFVRRQIAGDAMAADQPLGSVPTGFLVTGPNNDVGNGSELERKRERADELDDFVTNTTAALLGLTVGCARCHDHKFDPIPTRDYYRLVAVFSGVYYGDRPLATDAEMAERKAKLATLEDEEKKIKARLAEIDAQIAGMTGGPASPQRNEVTFAPTMARFVRMSIESTADGSAACLDELELLGPGSETNLGAATAGGRASASSLLPGYPIHQIAHLNDSQSGNDHSWIAATPGPCWAQIELPQPATIERVVWGRDQSGAFTDRVPDKYTIMVSDNGDLWRIVARRPDVVNSTPNQQSELADLRQQRQPLEKELEAIKARHEQLPSFTTTWAPISKPPETTHLLKRGDVTTPGNEVTPGALSAVHELPSDLVPNDSDDRARRLALAQWIASPKNPLTARVIVNRLWQHHFGAGLVENASDFGFHGGQPSHPALLDWLAAELVAHGWSLKHIHRLMLLSQAYQQSWRPTPDGAREDEENRLLWRRNRQRLEAEEIRDAILFTAGTLDLKPGGPSFHTFKYTDGNIPVFEPLEGDGRSTWRRTVYRHIVRSQSVPFLDVFDCPDSSVMTAKRSRTTTPLQALSLLNNGFVIEQSKLLADRLRKTAGDDVPAQVAQAVWLVFNRAPTDDEQRMIVEFVRQAGLERLGRVLWNANEFLYVE